MFDTLKEKINTKSCIIGVLGLGRVGLPLACAFASNNVKVVGIDVNSSRTDLIDKGICPFHDPPLQESLKILFNSGYLSTVGSLMDCKEMPDIIFVTVGTPNSNDNSVDYSQLYSALEDIGNLDLKNKMIIMRSTLPPQTTEDIVIPFLQQKTGLKAGFDFGLVVCPERILEGHAVKELKELPEIIGGINQESNDIVTNVFKIINPNKEFSYCSMTGAELAKLFTNIYRYISFALSNEFGIWAEKYGQDATELIKASNYNYPRSNIPIPGFVGGPCLSKDGTFLDNNTTFSSIVSAAWKLNESIPQHIINNIKKMTDNLVNKKVAILGISFKAGSDDKRNSPSVKLEENLRGLGAKLLVHDPYVKNTMTLEQVLESPDIVIIATNHKEFVNISEKINMSGCKIIYDVWGMFDEKYFPGKHYAKLGKDF